MLINITNKIIIKRRAGNVTTTIADQPITDFIKHLLCILLLYSSEACEADIYM